MKYGRKGFDFGDFEITKREILASISIIAVMILIGILISSKISEYQMDKNEIYKNCNGSWFNGCLCTDYGSIRRNESVRPYWTWARQYHDLR